MTFHSKEGFLPADEWQTEERLLTKQAFFKEWINYNPETGEIHRIKATRSKKPCFKKIKLLKNKDRPESRRINFFRT